MPWAFLYGLALPTFAYLAFGLNPNADGTRRLEFAGSCATFATFGVVLTISLSSQQQFRDPWNRYQRALPLGTTALLGARLAENALLILLSASLVLGVAVLTGVGVPWTGIYPALLLGSIPVALHQPLGTATGSARGLQHPLTWVCPSWAVSGAAAEPATHCPRNFSLDPRPGLGRNGVGGHKE